MDTPQPNVNELALAAASRILDSEVPKDEAKVETPKVQTPPETPPDPPAVAAPKETPPETPVAESKKWKLTVKQEDGTDAEIEVDEDTLTKGFMMERDYRAKTARVARERESVETEKQKAIQDARTDYEKNLQQYGQVVQATAMRELQGINWVELAAKDPAEYTRLKARQDELVGAMNSLVTEQQRIAQQKHQEFQQAQQQAATKAVEQLKDPINGIPNWNTDLYHKILDYAVKEEGMKQEQANAITDPVAIKVLWKAMRFADAQKAKPIVDKQVVNVPKVVKPGTAEKPDAKAEKWNEDMARLKKTGRESDAVGIAKMILERES